MPLGDFFKKSQQQKETKVRSSSSKSSKSQQQKPQTTSSALVAPDTKKQIDGEPRADEKGVTPDKEAVFNRQCTDVFRILNVEPRMQIIDVRAAEKCIGASADGEKVSRRNKEFMAWSISTKSAFLVLNGNARRTTAESTNIMTSCSVRCYSIHKKDKLSRLQLTWFATHHTDWQDPLEGVIGMLRGLCAQLLSRGAMSGRIDLSPFDGEQVEKKGSICCIIDGTHALSWHSEDFQYAFDFLKDLVKEFNLQHHPVALKILLTHPTMSTLSTAEWLGEYGTAFTPEGRIGDILPRGQKDGGRN
ncbi:hypothetical protein LTR37_004497 [Vermiconidia calcicola]|uniref:Uncharacterized protein n=1 Tax=Vermiconidia calcicola TaxID=1690605 RepID=A0ACC3NMN2_9PEZI|nr:hypothetical protein LTR37_004497 [Vermiconidia calcicola]